MTTKENTRLRTALAIATAKAKQIARAEFEMRLDPAAYRCHKEGEGEGGCPQSGPSWIAEGAGQRFDFSRTEAGEVLCISHSGGIYLLAFDADQLVRRCDCKAREHADTCKHEVAWEAVRMAHKMEREAAQAALRAEGAQMPPLCVHCLTHCDGACEYRDYFPGEGLEEAA